MLHSSKKNEVFVSRLPFIYSSVAPKARSLMQWELPLETLQHHVKSHNKVLPYHVKTPAVENQSLLLWKDNWYVEHGISFFILLLFCFFQSHLITQLPVSVPESPVRGFHTTALAGSCRWSSHWDLKRAPCNPSRIHSEHLSFCKQIGAKISPNNCQLCQLAPHSSAWNPWQFCRAALLVCLPAARRGKRYLPSYSSITGQQIPAQVKRRPIPIPTGVFEPLSSGEKFK